MRRFLNILSLVAIFGFLVVPFAFAQTTTPPAIQTFIDIIDRAVTWISIIVTSAATLVVVYGAFLFLSSGGDPEKTGSAKNVIVYGLIGVAVGLLASQIVNLFKTLVTG